MSFADHVRERTIPAWLSTATLKGVLLLALGFSLLVLPGVTITSARWAFGIGLVLSGLVDIWDGFRGRGEVRRYEFIHGATNIALGVVLVFVPSQALRLVLFVGAAYLAIRALSLVLDAWRHAGPNRPLQLLWGSALAAAAMLALLTPDHLVSAVIIGTAVAMIIAGGVLLAAGLTATQRQSNTLGLARVPVLIRRWTEAQDIGDSRRAEISDTLYFENPARAGKLAAWWVMLLLSVAIATFGVLQDSTAVVIGAMIVAPLMTPILGLAGAIVNAWPRRLVGSLLLVGAGAVVAVSLAVIIARWAPGAVPLSVNSQVTSRVTPNVLDMGIAVSAGAAGAFATVNRRVASSIAGVAIAVALVPPLAVVGLTLESSQFGDAWGAFLLFLTNVVSIVLTAVLVFLVTGMASLQRLQQESRRTVTTLGSFVAIALLILVPLTLTSQGLVVSASREAEAQRLTAEWVDGIVNLDVELVSVDGLSVEVLLSGSAQPPDKALLQESLDDAFGEPTSLRVEVFPSVVVR